MLRARSEVRFAQGGSAQLPACTARKSQAGDMRSEINSYLDSEPIIQCEVAAKECLISGLGSESLAKQPKGLRR